MSEELRIKHLGNGKVHVGYYSDTYPDTVNFICGLWTNLKRTNSYVVIEPGSEVTCRKCLNALDRFERGGIGG
jgi:hypothetical protein